MQYIKNIAGTFALVCLFSSAPAMAADWTGFYVGVHQADMDLEADWTTTEAREDDGLEIPFTSNEEASFKDSQSEVGVLIGFNFKLGPLVVGAQASNESFKFEDSIDDRIPGLGDVTSDPTSYVDFAAESDDVWVNLRAGFLVIPNVLVYATTGEAELDVVVTSTCPADTNVCNPAEGTQSSSSSKNMSGTFTGLGVEVAIGSIILRVERLDADFGSFDFTALSDQNGVSFGADAKIDVETEVTRLGVTYEF
jgi:outer membrane immunogenic protein